MLKYCMLLLLFPITLTAKEPITIGSKSFSESVIIAEMAAQLLEKKFDHPVKRKLNLGGTKIAFDALVSGDIDIYPDYTGTGYVMILKMDGERDPKKVHQIVSREFLARYQVVWSNPIGFNNTYALTVNAKHPILSKIDFISQLQNKVDNYKIMTPYEFMERKDGFPRMSEAYQLNFDPGNIIAMEAGLMYKAIANNKTDFIVSYSTDGRIKAFNLKVLKDDRKFFPPYEASMLSTLYSINKFPVLRDLLRLFEGLISEKEMIEMNDKVDRLKMEPKIVANNFLVKKGLIEGEKIKRISNRSFFGFAWSKRAYLLKLLLEHLQLSFGALIIAVLISIPLGIKLTRSETLAKIVFPIINTIQTVPSLALLGFLIPFLGIGFLPALIALFLYSLLPLVRNTYTGIQEVNPSFIEASKGIGLTDSQILWHVEIPLALPVIISGFRTAAVIVIGTTTIAALIGAGGFGDPIFRGVATVNSFLILLGAIPSALLAIVVDKGLGYLEKKIVSQGIQS